MVQSDMKSYTEATFSDVANSAKKEASKPSTGFLLLLWSFFVLNRALHPIAIDYSKRATSPGQEAGSFKLGSPVSLKGTGERYAGHIFQAEITDVTKDSVKVWYTAGGHKRYTKAELEKLLTVVTKTGPGSYAVGMQVRLKGIGARYAGKFFIADVVEISRDTVKVKYGGGGFRRFPKQQFEGLLTAIPEATDGKQEVGMHVRLQGTGKWYADKAFYVDIVDVSADTVKVLYADGTYKRMPKASFEALRAQKAQKGEVVRELRYKKLSPVLFKLVLCFLTCNVIALFDKDGWKAGLAKCHTGPSIPLFAFIGSVYALGDFLEMMSMGGMDGAAYQVLLQSKLVVTALMMWAIKGRSARQTRTQWAALLTVTLGMVIFMTTQSKGGSGGKKQAAGMFATSLVLLKVIVSCYAAVNSDASLKKYANLPLNAQLSQLFLPWFVMSFVLALIFEPSVVSSPESFFHGWNFGTILVVLSFSVKTVLTMTLLKTLDSISKNIGEAVAVLVIYVMQVTMPSFGKQFEMDTFVAMSIVVMTVTTYMFLKQDLDASKALAAPAPKKAADTV
eukprot:CAMPEP_0115101892 /NCGR_PEP_ID=MMETSP0227-20121206/33532_1 /TAXON_ID=89957 /ORGANISM="Polarella glacialis, Strain CCMP 1383" /LENGTH=561 /DNA_ID=CAMNT_0002497789 /DNA_START=73 /DNA_END=1758 /DNA_ORIENTATION=+